MRVKLILLGLLVVVANEVEFEIKNGDDPNAILRIFLKARRAHSRRRLGSCAKCWHPDEYKCECRQCPRCEGYFPAEDEHECLLEAREVPERGHPIMRCGICGRETNNCTTCCKKCNLPFPCGNKKGCISCQHPELDQCTCKGCERLKKIGPPFNMKFMKWAGVASTLGGSIMFFGSIFEDAGPKRGDTYQLRPDKAFSTLDTGGTVEITAISEASVTVKLGGEEVSMGMDSFSTTFEPTLATGAGDFPTSIVIGAFLMVVGVVYCVRSFTGPWCKCF